MLGLSGRLCRVRLRRPATAVGPDRPTAAGQDPSHVIDLTAVLSHSNGAEGCALLAVVALIAGIGIFISSTRKHSRADLMSSVAGRWNGQVTPADIFTNPSIQLRIEGV